MTNPPTTPATPDNLQFGSCLTVKPWANHGPSGLHRAPRDNHICLCPVASPSNSLFQDLHVFCRVHSVGKMSSPLQPMLQKIGSMADLQWDIRPCAIHINTLKFTNDLDRRLCWIGACKRQSNPKSTKVGSSMFFIYFFAPIWSCRRRTLVLSCTSATWIAPLS